MRSGHKREDRPLRKQDRTEYPDDVWIYVQAGVEYSDPDDPDDPVPFDADAINQLLRQLAAPGR